MFDQQSSLILCACNFNFHPLGSRAKFDGKSEQNVDGQAPVLGGLGPSLVLRRLCSSVHAKRF